VKPEVGPKKIQIDMEDDSNSSGTPKRKYSSESSSNHDKMYNVEDESPHQAKRERFDLIKSSSLVIQNKRNEEILKAKKVIEKPKIIKQDIVYSTLPFNERR
jgi:hypothetical protein